MILSVYIDSWVSGYRGGDFTEFNGRGGESIYGEKASEVITQIVRFISFVC